MNPLRRMRWWFKSRRFLEHKVIEQMDKIRKLEDELGRPS